MSNQIFIGGNALFDAPTSKHRLLTKVTTSSSLTPLYHEEYFWWARGTAVHDQALSASPVISIAGEFAATGKTTLFAAHLKFKRQTMGEMPIVENYTQVHKDEGLYCYGYRKERKAPQHWLVRRKDGHGKYYPGSVGMWDGVYKNDKQHTLMLTANYRAGGTLSFQFEGNAVVGYQTNTYVAKFEPFKRVVDVFSKSNTPKSSLEESSTGHSFYRDVLSRLPVLPKSPQVVITPDGLFENRDEAIRLIFPYADEVKKVFQATVKSFGDIPRKYHHLSREALYEVWVGNARQWMQKNPQFKCSNSASQSRALIPSSFKFAVH